MTEPERQRLRALIDEARRQVVKIVCPTTGRSLNYSYRQLNCRCEACRSHQQQERDRRRRGELRGIGHARKEHGISAYKTGRCRCEVCRLAANAARRARYQRAKAVV